MLYLIGAGLWDEKDLSIRGLEAAKKCQKVYLERYTSLWKGDLKKIGLKSKDLFRSDMEENLQKLLDEAKKSDIAVFVPGDALIATTHSTIVQEAKKQGIKVEIIHSSSIFSAIGETGLQVYKFGKTATIPYAETEAPYKILEENQKIGAHTLFLLDITPEELMTCGEGLRKLLEMEVKFKKKLISKETKVVVFCRAGSSEKVLKYDKASNLLNLKCTLCVIIVPGKLHFSEKEYLESL